MSTTFKLEEQCIPKHTRKKGNPSVSDLVMQTYRESDQAHLEYMCLTEEQAMEQNKESIATATSELDP